jgi:hypothetical protein
MGERKQKAESGEKKGKVGKGKKAGARVSHPILQLQQMVGNKAVTNMIQRHGEYALSNFDFKIRPLGASGDGHWLRGEKREQP